MIPLGISSRTSWLLNAWISYGPSHPIQPVPTTSLWNTITLLYSGKSRMQYIFGPFYIFNTQLIFSFAYILLSSTITFLTAIAYTAIPGDNTKSIEILGYIPYTKSIGTSLFGPYISFRHFSTSWMKLLLSRCCPNPCLKIIYSLCNL